MGSLPVSMGQQERSTLPCTTFSFGSMLCCSVLLGQPLVWPVLPCSCEQAETARPEELVETSFSPLFGAFQCWLHWVEPAWAASCKRSSTGTQKLTSHFSPCQWTPVPLAKPFCLLLSPLTSCTGATQGSYELTPIASS